jgi:hypothetical protein
MDEGVFDPTSISEIAFLVGPDRYEEADCEEEFLDVDDIFAKDFDRVWREQELACPGSLSIEPTALRTPSLRAEGYSFVDVDAGLLLLAPDGSPCGGYIGCDLVIAPEHQGKGLGAELVLEYAMRNGDLPTWWLDAAAYSVAGEAAHRAAYALAQDRDFFVLKRDELINAKREQSMVSEIVCCPAV